MVGPNDVEPGAVDAAVQLFDGRLPAGAGPNVPGSSLAPFFPQPRPIFEALSDFALEAAFGRVIEFLALKGLREVVLSRESLFRIVIVGVATAIAFVLHKPCRRIKNMLGRQQRPCFLRRAHGRAEGSIRSVRFGCGCAGDNRLPYGELSLWRAKKVVPILGRIRDNERRRTG